MLSLAETPREYEVPLPDALGRLGGAMACKLTGRIDQPAVVALGGISGNRHVCEGASGGPGWWAGLVGPGCAVDPALHCVIGVDYAADPTGRSAPSTHDQARVLAAVLDAIGVGALHALVGASYGGMVALAFAELFPERVGRIAVISACAEPHPMASANRELQRRTVAMGIERGCGDEALAIARGMAMLTYRTPAEFNDRFRGGIDGEDPLDACEAGGYLRSRGRAFREVMSPERFLSLSASIDRHRVDPAAIATPALLVGAATDQLVPPEQMRSLAERLAGPNELHLRDCIYGHDMFLKEAAAMSDLLWPFLAR